jgi:hypothetical protein
VGRPCRMHEKDISSSTLVSDGELWRKACMNFWQLASFAIGEQSGSISA